jgi:hypothetical protein
MKTRDRTGLLVNKTAQAAGRLSAIMPSSAHQQASDSGPALIISRYASVTPRCYGGEEKVREFRGFARVHQ